MRSSFSRWMGRGLASLLSFGAAYLMGSEALCLDFGGPSARGGIK